MKMVQFDPHSITIELANRLSEDELFDAYRTDRLDSEAKSWAGNQPNIRKRMRDYARAMMA